MDFPIKHGDFPYNVGPPSDVCWFINPMNYSYLRTINHSEIGVIGTNLAIVWGPTLYGYENIVYGKLQVSQMMSDDRYGNHFKLMAIVAI